MAQWKPDELYEKYYGKILGYIRSKISDPYLAEDLCEEVFLKVCEKLDGFDESKAQISTWIYTIARNKMIDYFRGRRITEEIPETLEDGSNVEEEVFQKESLNTLADALEALDERERDLIILHYYSGLTLKEAADRIGVSYSYAKLLHNKALQSMRGFF